MSGSVLGAETIIFTVPDQAIVGPDIDKIVVNEGVFTSMTVTNVINGTVTNAQTADTASVNLTGDVTGPDTATVVSRIGNTDIAFAGTVTAIIGGVTGLDTNAVIRLLPAGPISSGLDISSSGGNVTLSGTAADSSITLQPTGARGVVIGAGTASGTLSAAIGSGNTANGNTAVAIGNTNTSSGTNSVAIGESCQATGANSVAIGKNAVVNNPDDHAFRGTGNLRMNYTRAVINAEFSNGTTTGGYVQIGSGDVYTSRFYHYSTRTTTSGLQTIAELLLLADSRAYLGHISIVAKLGDTNIGVLPENLTQNNVRTSYAYSIGTFACYYGITSPNPPVAIDGTNYEPRFGIDVGVGIGPISIVYLSTGIVQIQASPVNRIIYWHIRVELMEAPTS
jgi:Head domain of trimeric autotransporter adhesin